MEEEEEEEGVLFHKIPLTPIYSPCSRCLGFRVYSLWFRFGLRPRV
jgi:hypothetical protein